jgi:membrane protease YdiL (CAAX protease family)
MFLTNAHKGKNDFWRYIICLLVALVASQVIGAIPLGLAIILSGAKNIGTSPAQIIEATGLSKNLFLVLMLIPFIIGLICLVAIIKTLHGRTFKDTTTGANKFRFNRFLKGFLLWFFLYMLMMGTFYFLNPENFVFNFQPEQFFILILISFLLIPIQTGFEEVLFRGYLMQGFYLLTKDKWKAVIITGVLFAAIHGLNPEVKAFGLGLAMGQYMLFGLMFGFITVMDDGIELAWGAHAANNIFVSIFVTYKAFAIQTPALFTQKELNPVLDLNLLFVAAALFTLICFKAFKWKFSKADNPA